MKNKIALLFGLFWLLLAAFPIFAEVELDDPSQAVEINRQIWTFAKHSSFSAMQTYVKKSQERSRRPNEIVLPTGWAIAPAGSQLQLGRMPSEGLTFAGSLVVLNNGYYRKEDAVVSFVNPDTNQVDQVLTFHSLFPSAKVGLDGDLYISGGFDGKVYRINSAFKRVKEYALPGYAAGLAPIDEKHLAVVLLFVDKEMGTYEQGALAILNTETAQVDQVIPAGIFPYAVEAANQKLYVTLEGQNKVLVFTQGEAGWSMEKQIPVGKNPTRLCADGGKLYVVDTGSDELSVIDTRTDAALSSISLRKQNFSFGVSPTSCLSSGSRLYVTLANLNAVAVVDKISGKVAGYVPSGWYPTDVFMNGRELCVLSAKGVRPRRPNPQLGGPTKPPAETDYVLTLLNGSLGRVPLKEIQAQLRFYSKKVLDGSPLLSPEKGFKIPIHHIFYVIRENRTYDQVLGDLPRGNGDPHLTVFGKGITPNQHQMAENFVTLDNFYVDGEISVLGHSFTTSGYASPFLEWLGNVGYADRLGPVDPKDKTKRKNFWPYNVMPGVFSPYYLWDDLDDKGVDYRIYGEDYYLYTKPYRILMDSFGADSEQVKKYEKTTLKLAGTDFPGTDAGKTLKPYWDRLSTREGAEKLLLDPDFASAFSKYYLGDESLTKDLAENGALRARFADFLFRYVFAYRAWDLKYSDMDRVKAWKASFDQQVKDGKVAQLHYIWLPNDHTAGLDPKSPTPFQYVAQNDAAFGFVVESIAKSPVWKDSLILSVEDDCQNGPDHVDADRTIAYAVGPYVKRGAVVSDSYDQESLLRTIELALGMNPLNMNDALAVPMMDIFTDQPDETPYVAPEPSKELRPEDLRLYQELHSK